MSILAGAGMIALLALGLHTAGGGEAMPQGPREDPDGKTLWYDCRLLTIEGKGWQDTKSFYDRLPARAEGMVRPPVWNLSRDSAGFCVRFTTDARSIRVRWTLGSASLAMPHMAATGVSGVDLYRKTADGRWEYAGTGRPTQVTNETQLWTGDGKEFVLYLPLYNSTKLVEIGIPKDKHLAPAPPRTIKPVVFYGTSITQGGCASRTGTAYTAIVGRMLDVPVINLGFSGNGKMELELAELLGELEASVYVLDCLWNMTPEMVAERVEPFVRKLRGARPNTPILLAEDCNYRNEVPTTKGKIVRKIYDRLVAEGMKGLYFLSAKGMLGEDTEGTVDGCHPTDLGMMRMAKVFAEALRPLVGK